MIVPILALMAASAAAPAAMPEGEEMRAAIEENDAALFWAAFEGCDPKRLEEILTPDYRMLHDLGGLAIESGQAMVDQMTEECAARAKGGDHAGYKNRRRAVPGSRIVRKLGDWGALEEGSHVFYEWRAKDKSWELVGGARYMHVWKWIAEEGKFRLNESLSYDHGAAGQYPPPQP